MIVKANEFVKKFGWFTSKEYMAGATIFDNNLMVFTNRDDLKQLIEAKELVEFGIPDLKKSMFSNSKSIEDVKNWLLSVSDSLLTEKGVELKKAIQLVESCQ